MSVINIDLFLYFEKSILGCIKLSKISLKLSILDFLEFYNVYFNIKISIYNID